MKPTKENTEAFFKFAKEVEEEYFKGLSFQAAVNKVMEGHGLILEASNGSCNAQN